MVCYAVFTAKARCKAENVRFQRRVREGSKGLYIDSPDYSEWWRYKGSEKPRQPLQQEGASLSDESRTRRGGTYQRIGGPFFAGLFHVIGYSVGIPYYARYAQKGKPECRNAVPAKLL